MRWQIYLMIFTVPTLHLDWSKYKNDISFSYDRGKWKESFFLFHAVLYLILVHVRSFCHLLVIQIFFCFLVFSNSLPLSKIIDHHWASVLCLPSTDCLRFGLENLFLGSGIKRASREKYLLRKKCCCILRCSFAVFTCSFLSFFSSFLLFAV